MARDRGRQRMGRGAGRGGGGLSQQEECERYGQGLRGDTKKEKRTMNRGQRGGGGGQERRIRKRLWGGRVGKGGG